MAQKDLPFISTVVLLRDTHGTNKEIQQGELTRIGYAKELTNIESVSHTIAKQDGQPSGAVYKLCGDFSSNLPSKSAEMMYCITPVSISIKFDPKLEAAFSDVMTRSSLLNFEEQKDCVVITGPIESVMIFLNDLDQQGAKLLLTNKSNVATATSDYLSSEPEAIPALSTSQYGHNVYDNMSPDALALLEKLPIGSIKGVHYDPSAGRVLIDKETPQLEEERISKFQSAYQSITGKKLKIITVPVPSGASPDAVATLVHQYNVTYDQCVFTQEEEVIKIISISSRQIDQAKVLLSEDIFKAINSATEANEKFEVIHLSTGRTLTLKKANLVLEEVDIIVNPANERLSHGGGIAAALNRASNEQLQKYSNRYVQTRGRVSVGKVAITEGGGALKCSKVIHAVGPEKGKHSEADCERLLNRVIKEALKSAERLNASSISFPAISTGIFGVKKELVARCLVDTIMAYHFTKPSPVLSDIRVAIIDEKTYAPFARYFQQKQKNTQRSVIQPAKFKPSHLKTTKPPTSPQNSPPTSPPTSPPALITSPVPESIKGKTTEDDTILSEASQASTTSASKTQDRKLSLKDIGRIQDHLRSLANDWHALGSALGFQKAALDQMSVIPADSNVHLGRLLNRWLAGDAHSPTVSVLVNALHCIEGTNDVVQGIVTAYEMPVIPTIQESPPEGGDINSILYPTNFPDLNPGLTSDGSCPTPSTTITTSAGGQLSNLSAQMSVDESTQALATGTKDGDQQNVDTSQWNTSSAPSFADFSHSPTTCVVGMITATPTPSTIMTYSSSPATVSTPPPGFSNPTVTSPVGYNSGRPYSYTSTNGQEGSFQFPFSGTGEHNSQQHTRPGGIQHMQHATPQSISQGNPPQQVAFKNVPPEGLPLQHTTPQGISQGGHPPQQAGFQNMSKDGLSQNPHNASAVSYTQGRGGHSLDSTTRSRTSNPTHTTSGGMPNYQAASGSNHTSTTQPAHSNVWSTQSGTSSMSFSQAVTAGGSQGNTFSHGTAVTNQPRPQKQHQQQTENCPICFDGITNPVRTVCGHYFCKDCLDKSLLYAPYCPTCKTPLQTIVGNQPIGGTMTSKRHRSRLPGYYHCGTIEIHYYIPDGVQTQEHPNPGRRFTGTTRRAYLPDNLEGQEVLQLLSRAFDARLIFTVGTSVTTGQNDVVTWNDIHHKTNTHGGQQSYGYPDPTYLQRVKDDLKAKGIIPLHGSTV